MALIYSYPSLTPLSGLDTLLVSDATDDNRTTNVSIAELSEYIATYTLLEGNSDAADFVNELKDLIVIDGGNVLIQGLASFSSVEALSSSRAAFETKVSADQESAFASLKLEVDSEFKSYVNGKLSTYASSDAVTELISETTADYAIASDVTKLNAQFEFDAGGNITGTSGALVTAINAASADSDQAFATQVNKLNAQFDIDGDGNITGLSSANIDSVKSVVASEGYASATSQAEIRVDVDDASATASDNVTAIATETLARVTKDEELVASIGNEEDGTGVYAAVRTVAEAVVTESEARAQEKTTLEAAIGSNTSAFEDYVIVKATEDAAQAIREEDMKTEFRGNNTAFQNFKNITYADAEQARSEEINTIRASASGAGALAGTNAGEITETKRVVADIEGNIEATWKLDVTAGNRIAGMKLQADDVSSSVTFNADAFKVYNTSKGIAEAPFRIEDGEVVIQSASIKNVDFGAIDNVPDAMHATMIFADDADGTNPSTTQGSKNFVLHYNSKWINGDPIPYTPFNMIEGPRGETGTTGTSFRLRGSVTSHDDLPSDTASVGDGYILGEDLFVYQGGVVWSNVGVIRGPVGLTGEPGEDGVGIDGLDGVDGDYVSYIYIVDNGDTPPSAPVYTEGSFNGTQEVVPTGWSDNPSADLDDVEWMSTRRYKNSKTVNNNGDTVSSWEPLQWSTPTRIYQRGETGNTPRKNFDYFDGVDGTYTSFVFRTTTEDTAPGKPTGGSYSSTTGETFPLYWYDNPTATAEDIEWVSKAVYQNIKTYDAAGNETSTWIRAGGGWSEPSKIFQKGDRGDTGPRGPIGRRGPDGTSVTIKGAVESIDDLPQGDNSSGDGYLIGGILWVWSEEQDQFLETGNIQGPGGETGAPGEDGDPGEDGFDGNDGIYTSFVYRVSDTLPSAPQYGSFNGAVEVYPTSDGATWTDNPSVDDEDTEWRSSIKYKNTKTFDDSSGTRVETNTWTQIGSWSTPVKIYQKGLPGNTGQAGNSVNIKGSVDSTSDLPNSGNQLGDCYLINGVLFVYDGNPDFIEAGSIKGDKGDNGDTPQKFRDYYDGNDGAFTSFIFRVTSDNNAPTAPTDGSYNGSSEVIPSNWSDEPLTGDHDVQWTSTRKYSHNAQTGVWSSSSWSTPAKYIQKGDRGPIGPRGVDGTSVTILEELDSISDLPASSTNPTNGDGYLIAGNLWVWNTVQGQFLDVGSIQGPAGAPGASITGEPGDTGEDGLDGDDGIYTSFVYKVQDTKPNRPTSSTGSFDGTTEVMPDSDTSTPWTDNPSVSTQDVEWRSSMKYKNTKSVNAQGDKLSVWTKVTEHWSEPAKIYQKGLVGDTGTSITMKGSVGSVALLPSNTTYHINAKGDSYMVGSVMYTWTGTLWDDVGDFEGPPGINGTTPLKGRDYYDGNKGQLTSLIFRVSENTPSAPSGGSYNGVVETFPQYWTDDPSADEDEKEWVSVGKYNHDAVLDTWSFGGWSTPKVWYKQGAKGDTGPRGHVGPDGKSVTIKGTLENEEDLNNLNTSEHEAGDGYLIDGDLWVFDGTDWQDVGNIQGPTGPIGAIGPDGNPGIDGINGNDGIYTSFVYLAQDELPGVPVGGSFNGSVEVYPTSNDGQWSDNPTVSTQDTEWRSMIKYQNTKTVDDSGETRVYQSAWTQIGSWSQPVKSYQKGATGGVGLTGPSGASVVMRGKKDNQNELPVNTETHTNQIGDTYLIASEMHTWDGGEWKNLGSLKGDTGDRGPRGASVTGEKGDTGLDGYNGKDGVYTSFVYMVSDDQPGIPTGGTWNGASETYPSSTEGYWTDNPTVDDEDTEWRSSIKYLNQKTFEEVDGVRTQTSDTWSQLGGWSTPRKIFQKGDKGDTGSSVRLEFSADGTTGWSTQPSADTKWQRASTSAPNSNYWVAGTAIKFVPTAGVEYSEPSNGASVYLHIKYSDDGVQFTRNSAGVRDGETPGAWTGVYRTYSTDAPSSTPPEDPLTFSLYTWNKVQGDTPPPTPPLYQWVRYADNIHGTSNFSSTIGTRKFKGVAINKESQTASNSAADYTWSKFVPDEPTVKYMWVRYSDSATGSNYVSNSAGKDYVGFAYNKSTVNPPNGTPASDFDWSKVGGTTGETGRKVVTGTLFFQAKSKNVPSLDGAIGKSYFFNSNSVANEVKNAGWDVKTPEMTAGTASNNYWSVPFTAVQNENSNKGTLAFGTVTRAFAFNQVVTFDSLESDGTTEINGANIKTGAIQSQNYSNSSGDDHSTNGMKIDLTGNGSIHAKEFYINADGTSSFTGKHTAGELGNWQVENGSLKDSDNRIELNPSSKSIQLKNQSGEVKTKIRASTSLTELGENAKTFSFTGSTPTQAMRIQNEGTITSNSSNTSSRDYTRHSITRTNSNTLEAGDELEIKVSDLSTYVDWEGIYMDETHTDQIPAIVNSTTAPYGSIRNAATTSGYHVHGALEAGTKAKLKRTLKLELWKEAESYPSLVKSYDISSATAIGGRTSVIYEKQAGQNKYDANNWIRWESTSAPSFSTESLKTSDDLSFEINQRGDYYFSFRLVTSVFSGNEVNVAGSGSISNNIKQWTWSLASQQGSARQYMFSSRTQAERSFTAYETQNFAELCSGGLQVVTNFAKYIKIPISDAGESEETNVLLEARGGRVDIQNDSGVEALRVSGDVTVNGSIKVNGGWDTPNNKWDGADLGSLALSTNFSQGVPLGGSSNDNYGSSNDGNIKNLIREGKSSIFISPDSDTQVKYELPYDIYWPAGHPTYSDDRDTSDPYPGSVNGQIITIINIHPTRIAKIKGILRTEGVDSFSSLAPGGSLTLQHYKYVSGFTLGGWSAANGLGITIYSCWFVIGSNGYS